MKFHRFATCSPPGRLFSIGVSSWLVFLWIIVAILASTGCEEETTSGVAKLPGVPFSDARSEGLRRMQADDFSWTFARGNHADPLSRLEELSRFDLIVKTWENSLGISGPIVIVYVPFMEYSDWMNDRPPIALTREELDRVRIGENRDWSSTITDTCNAEWRSYIIERYIPFITRNGADGVLFDTIGDTEFTGLEWQQECAAEFLVEIRRQYPDYLFMINEGVSVLNYIESPQEIIDAVMLEHFYTQSRDSTCTPYVEGEIPAWRTERMERAVESGLKILTYESECYHIGMDVERDAVNISCSLGFTPYVGYWNREDWIINTNWLPNPCGGSSEIRECRADETRRCGTSEIGECRYGRETCSGGHWGTCSGSVEPQSESCDGRDNDCDGVVDEGCSAELPACVSTQGQCSAWEHPIEEGGWGGQLAWTPLDGTCSCPPELAEDSAVVFSDGCVGFPAGSDFCDDFGRWDSLESWARDNVGRTDVVDCYNICWTPLIPRNEDSGEIPECRDGETRQCGSSEIGECSYGLEICVDGHWGSCSGSVGAQLERCDSLDNDCDGEVDESWPSLGDRCSVGVGECHRTGTEICRRDGRDSTCSVSAGTPTDEICDGRDNDCDGVVDEGCSAELPACVSTQGQCSAWEHPIEEGGWGGQLAWTPLDGTCSCPPELAEDSAVVFSDGCVGFPAGSDFCDYFGRWDSLESWARDNVGRTDVVACYNICWTPHIPR
jgi:hypothetical protein